MTMPPKKIVKIPKYERDALEALSRAEIIKLAREERDAGATPNIGSLARSTSDIIDSMMKLKVVNQNDQVEDKDNEVVDKDDEIEELEAKLKVAKLAKTNALKTHVDVDFGTSSTSKTRLVPPSSLPSEPDRGVFRTWNKEVQLWLKTHASHSDDELVTMLMISLSTTEKSDVFACHSEAKPLTPTSLLTVLVERYGGDELEQRRQKLAEFRGCWRNKRPLATWLPLWTALRSQCVQLGLIPDLDQVDESACWDLLEAAELSASQRAAIMHELSSRDDMRAELSMPAHNSASRHKRIRELLRELALSFTMGEGKGQQQGKQSEQAALFTGKSKGAKKGKQYKGGLVIDRYVSPYGSAGKGKQHKGDLAFDMSRGTGRREVTCWTCGKAGHTSPNCWQGQTDDKDTALMAKGGKKGARKGKTGKAKEKCHRCKKEGHRAFECTAAEPFKAER